VRSGSSLTPSYSDCQQLATRAASPPPTRQDGRDCSACDCGTCGRGMALSCQADGAWLEEQLGGRGSPGTLKRSLSAREMPLHQPAASVAQRRLSSNSGVRSHLAGVCRPRQPARAARDSIAAGCASAAADDAVTQCMSETQTCATVTVEHVQRAPHCRCGHACVRATLPEGRAQTSPAAPG
jgi:hypothetical protein